MDKSAKRRAEINKTVPHGIKAIIFDLDGVLVDAADWHRDAFNASLESKGLEAIPNDEHLVRLNGLSTKRKLSILAREGRVPYTTDFQNEIYAIKQQKTLEIINKKCMPNQRVIETVVHAFLTFHMNIAVATNCSRHTAELMLERSGLKNFFNVIVTNNDVGEKIKPHAWPYLLAQQKLGLGCMDRISLAIDDTDKGIMSAVNARMRTWHLNKFKDLTEENLIAKLDNYRITI